MAVGVLTPSESVESGDGQKKSYILSQNHNYYDDGEYVTITPSIKHEESFEVYTYKRPSQWCGLVVVIPLMLPVCSVEDVFYFNDGSLVKQVKKTVEYSGLLCSIFPTCKSGNDCTLCFIN